MTRKLALVAVQLDGEAGYRVEVHALLCSVRKESY